MNMIDAQTVDVIVVGAARIMEIAGVLVLVVGAIAATVVFLLELRRERKFRRAYQHFRGHLGRTILLGLELLVAADIIATISVDPTFRDVGVLAGIVLIRTFLSFALEVEINGRWPWRQAEAEPPGSPEPEL